MSLLFIKAKNRGVFYDFRLLKTLQHEIVENSNSMQRLNNIKRPRPSSAHLLNRPDIQLTLPIALEVVVEAAIKRLIAFMAVRGSSYF